MAGGHSAPNAVDFIKRFSPTPLNLDDDNSTDLDGDRFPSYCTPNEVIHLRDSPNVDDDPDLDVMFDQYLRSPSLSPTLSPDDAASDLSGATIIGAERDQNTSSAVLSREPSRTKSRSPVPKHIPQRQQAGHQEDMGQLKNGLRIRSRVSQPRIMLRLKLPAGVRADMKGNRGEKRKTIKQGTQRGRGKEGNEE